MRVCSLLTVGLMGVGIGGVGAPALAQTSVQFGVGADYSSGDYGGTENIAIYQVPFSVRLKTGAWSFRARVPFATVEGPGGVVPGSDDIGADGLKLRGDGTVDDDDPIPLPTADTSRRSGIGDVALSATYSFDIGRSNYFDLTGRVSLPTGDADNDLGTGETDYALSGEFGHDTDSGGLYAGGGYRMRGGVGREDVAFAFTGLYGRISGSTIAGVEASWSEASRTGVDDPAALTGYLSFNLSNSLRLSTFVETGLSDNAADIGAGFGLTWRPNFRRPFQSN